MTRKHALDNLGQTFRTITVRGFLPWDPETSERLYAAALQQLNARNLFTEELLKHPDTPIQKSAAKNETGLYGLWLQWRDAVPYLAETRTVIWRPAASLAKTAVGAWSATNTKHAELVGNSEAARRTLLEARGRVRKAEEQARAAGLTDEEQESYTEHDTALQKAEGVLYTARDIVSSRLENSGQKPTKKILNDDPAIKNARRAVAAATRPVTRLRKQAETQGLTDDERSRLATDRKALQKAATALEKALRKARNAEKRAIRPETLFVSRTDRDRHRRNMLAYHEGVTVSDDRRSLNLPEIGSVQLSKPVRADLDVRSATLLERTPPAKGNCRRLPASERTWRVLIQGRLDAPLKKIPDDPEDIVSAGGDHGVKHALTISNSDGTTQYYHYTPLSKSEIRRWTRLNARKERCTCGSREWKRLQRLMRAITARHARRKAQTRLEWANAVAKSQPPRRDRAPAERQHARLCQRPERGRGQERRRQTGAQPSPRRDGTGVPDGCVHGGLYPPRHALPSGTSSLDQHHLQRLRVQRQQEPGEPSGLPLSEVRVRGKRRRERRTRNPATRAGVQQGRSRPVLDGGSHQNRRHLGKQGRRRETAAPGQQDLDTASAAESAEGALRQRLGRNYNCRTDHFMVVRQGNLCPFRQRSTLTFANDLGYSRRQGPTVPCSRGCTARNPLPPKAIHRLRRMEHGRHELNDRRPGIGRTSAPRGRLRAPAPGRGAGTAHDRTTLRGPSTTGNPRRNEVGLPTTTGATSDRCFTG